MITSYKEALEAAGAIVHEFQDFYSYHGEWWAKVTYEGRTGWVSGSFGSCHKCDDFDMEFLDKSKKEPDYQEKLSVFGKKYLEHIKTQAQAEAEAAKNIDWDLDAEKMLAFIKGAA